MLPDVTGARADRVDRAAVLVAADRLSDREIAAEVGVAKMTLERWKRRPDFQARIAQIREVERVRLEREHIAHKQQRITGQVERHRLLERIIRERATTPSMAEAPGGATGLLVRQVKLVKVYQSPDPPEEGGEPEPEDGDRRETLYSAKRVVEVAEYALDTGLLKEMRELEKQVAIELGEWTEKHELAGRVGQPLEIRYVNDWRNAEGRSA